MIKITAPYLEKRSSSDMNYVRLCSKIYVDDKEELVWYEVEEAYSEYLCYEKADAFVVGILPFAMAFGHNITVEGCPISEKLYWNMNQTFLPALAKFTNYYRRIELSSEVTDMTFDAKGVGSGFSAGVDSFDTLLRNTNEKTKGFNLTHLTFFNVGACGSYGGESAEKTFKERTEQYQPLVEKFGLQFVKVNSNLSEVLMMSFNFTHTYRSASAALALQKLFGKYYYSAGFPLNMFSFNPYSSAFYDLLNMQCFSTESISFYVTGAVATRLEKVQFISQHEETYKLLNVCNKNSFNCRTCEKCIRTMSELYSINMLDKYSEVFDVEYFRKHLAYNMAFVMSKSADGTVEALYFKNIINKIRENKLRIPFSSYFIAIPLKIKFIAIATARKSKTLKRWWHKKKNQEFGVRHNDI
ncbi:MAG: hypothetical protein IJV88_07095 [Ruminococcus sp.]|nr:hypothetical protein [Ruminococcus sp.]